MSRLTRRAFLQRSGFFGLSLATGQAARPDDRPSPLAGLPSTARPHIDKIKALADNEWLNLGSPAADPKWGKGRGRSWSARMAYAPDLKAAFLFGEGVHCWFNKQNNRYMDDLFVYDIPGHRWICAYPGTDVMNVDLKLDKNGIEVDRDGRPVPVGQLGHGYEMLTYDSDLRRFLFIPGASGDWQAQAPFGKRRMAWGVKGQGLPPASTSPWIYDVRSAAWDLRKVEGTVPSRTAVSLGMTFVYIPSMKKAFSWNPSIQEAWFYDPTANTWANARPKGLPAACGIDKVACLDPKRERIYLGGNSVLWCYDIKSNTMLDLQAKGKPPQTQDGYAYGAFSTSRSVMNYDSVGDAVLMFYHGNVGPSGSETRGRGVHVYDPVANAWAETPLTVPKELCKCPSSFYDPELNVHFIHCAGDSADDGVMLAYRFKKAGK